MAYNTERMLPSQFSELISAIGAGGGGGGGTISFDATQFAALLDAIGHRDTPAEYVTYGDGTVKGALDDLNDFALKNYSSVNNDVAVTISTNGTNNYVFPSQIPFPNAEKYNLTINSLAVGGAGPFSGNLNTGINIFKNRGGFMVYWLNNTALQQYVSTHNGKTFHLKITATLI